MKIISLHTRTVYEIEPNRNGENSMVCPECSKNRKPANQKKKPFNWNNEKMVGYCNHCGATFMLHREQKEKEFTVPQWENRTGLTDKAVKWFTGRMIKQDVLNAMGIVSVKEWMPQFQKEVECIAFPYKKDGAVVNVKYRGAQKSFKVVSGAELILWNIDVVKSNNEIVIVEGEMDLLSYLCVGVKNVVSVPAGASSNSDYLNGYMDWFNHITKIYLAVDNDPKGYELRNELERRFGTERCAVVNFKDCKDANEYLLKYGGIALADTIRDAIDIPVTDIVNLKAERDDIYNFYLNGEDSGLVWDVTFDDCCKWETRRLAVVTGIPGHGKSEFVDYIAAKLNIEHGFKVGYFSPENIPIRNHYAKIASKLTGKRFKAPNIDNAEYDEVFDYIEDNFHFILPEEDLSIENILEKGKYLVKKYGIKVFVLDPYNKIEHLRGKNETETEYISRVLDRLTMFAKRYDVLVFLVAHPRKMGKENGKLEIPNLYDISGSAHFYNKCDYGITVFRLYGDKENPINEVYIRFQKIKFSYLGEGGEVKCKRNYNNGRYEAFDKDVLQWDNSNWLHKREVPDELWDFGEIDNNIPF